MAPRTLRALPFKQILLIPPNILQPVQNVLQAVRAIGYYAIHSHFDKPLHFRFLINGPDYDLFSYTLNVRNQITIYNGSMSNEDIEYALFQIWWNARMSNQPSCHVRINFQNTVDRFRIK